jgi:citrate lyase subunit alpha/citrate CoA-transferase
MVSLPNIPKYQEFQKSLHGEFSEKQVHKDYLTLREHEKSKNKIVESLQEAIRLSGLKDGMTISFHHHFRNGDFIVNMVVDAIAKLGIKHLTLAASSLIDIHKPLIEHIKNGVIHRIETSGLRGELGEAISHGLMDMPVIFRSHGGRAAAIESGEITIDVAFLGAPSCDPFGNANGYSRDNDKGIVCGSMGYAKSDAQFAKKVIILTDNIIPFPNVPFGIPENNVDYIVKVDSIGDPQGIMVGATRFTKDPKELMIAETASNVIEASGLFQNGFSMQMGSGGASLAVARFLREKMVRNNIKASFALGGITGQMVTMHKEGLIKKILDVQSFDLEAANSLKNNRMHQQISASYYASPYNDGSAVNQLDFVILSALEVDVNFNTNVLVGSDGLIRGAIGGHQDTAAGAAISIITCPLTRGRMSTIVDNVQCLVTPGKTIDVIVTDHGVAVNPLRPDLKQKLVEADIQVVDIKVLQQKALKLVGRPIPISYTDKIVGIVTYRDGSIIDLVRQVKDTD